MPLFKLGMSDGVLLIGLGWLISGPLIIGVAIGTSLASWLLG